VVIGLLAQQRKRVPEPVIVLVAGAIGLVVYPLMR
jgi:hypothetical protein